MTDSYKTRLEAASIEAVSSVNPKLEDLCNEYGVDLPDLEEAVETIHREMEEHDHGRFDN